jgi:hypothetical protein
MDCPRWARWVLPHRETLAATAEVRPLVRSERMYG